MKLPEDIQQLLIRRFKNKYRDWLIAGVNEQDWPLEIKLGMPTEEAAIQQVTGVRAWVTAWQAWQGSGCLSWCERHWKLLGIQRLPHILTLQSPEQIAVWAGETERWQCVQSRYQALIIRWPMLDQYLSRYLGVLIECSDIDFQRLFTLLDWITAHPQSDLYPRQLPIADIDSKWLERHKGLVTDLVAAIQGDSKKNLNFYQRCGLKAPPLLIRMRILDPALRNRTGGLSDITAPVGELAALNLPVSHVFIVENLQTGLAMPEFRNTVVLMGLGYHVDVLAYLPWIRAAKCIYWGDLDTHGFAILHKARSYLPHLQSILMDENTLLSHQALWVEEKEQHAAQEWALLTEAEQAVYSGLKQQRWSQQVRLEQERIAWDYALKVLRSSETF